MGIQSLLIFPIGEANMDGSTIAVISSFTENATIFENRSKPARAFDSGCLLDSYGTITRRKFLDSFNHLIHPFK
ncbi:hypothetical protein BST28156_00111 [Burkholderia stagnalis]|nr:hypothetical protein BST28156_00111 [Burkholderia stagnalis]